jgi:hypothetical protein
VSTAFVGGERGELAPFAAERGAGRATLVALELAYCAWTVLLPAALARYEDPALTPWCACFVRTARTNVPRAPADAPGQALRRAIIRGATREEPFPGEVRAKALLVAAEVRHLSIEQLAERGTPGDVCRELGCARRPVAVADVADRKQGLRHASRRCVGALSALPLRLPRSLEVAE